jgi:tripartite-type tricarboxylate transporter receptor subunit TctC
MKHPHFQILTSLMVALLAATTFAQTTSTGSGQTYPVKVVRLLVPFSAGSGSDTIGRIYAGGLSEVFGQQVIVENRAGAAGNIGAEVAARAPADGYLLLLVNMAHAVNVTMYRKLGYDPIRDFAPVTMLATGPAILVVHPSLPVKSVKEWWHSPKRGPARSITRRQAAAHLLFWRPRCSSDKRASICCMCRTVRAVKRSPR